MADGAKSNHPWDNRRGNTEKKITWDRLKNVVAVKVGKGPGLWLEIGYHPGGGSTYVWQPYVIPAANIERTKLRSRIEGKL